MTEQKDLIRKSKHLAFLLRHDTDYAFDEHGWREVRDLVRNHGYSRAELEEIVATNDKQRYEFNAQHTKIRPVKDTRFMLMWSSKNVHRPIFSTMVQPPASWNLSTGTVSRARQDSMSTFPQRLR